MHVLIRSRIRSCLRSGEEPHTAIVASISNSNPAVVTCVEDERLQFQVRRATVCCSNPQRLLAVAQVQEERRASMAVTAHTNQRAPPCCCCRMESW